MDYQANLEFLRQLLQGMNISSCIVNNPYEYIPPEIDLNLRKELFGLDNYVTHLENSMEQANPNTIYRFFDEYDCNYIFLKLPSKNDASFFFIGPYLLDIPPKERIEQKAELLELTAEQKKQMHRYYTGLPMIEDENILLTMANTFGKTLWGTESYSMNYIEYAILDRHKPIPAFKGENSNSPALSLATLEANYKGENFLMDAVSKGKLHLITAVAASGFHTGSAPSVSDSLRNRKNDLIILKTLLRKAAEYGGVHPLHIDKLSNHFAGKIEAIRTIKQSLRLQEEMIRSYCLLVKQHSLSSYSYYVGQAITLVQYDLTADLKLKTIAEKLNVNASYLSALFHKEYGSTLTEFINKQRIDHGILLLQSSKKSVQEIAEECGIHDTNYFIKLFKKQTGFTPNQYREKVVGH